MDNHLTKTIRLNVNNESRLIFISDIHGDLDTLKKSLEKVVFNEFDYLFILGDLIEKGYQNIETLDYLMELTQKNEKVILLNGNCDDILRHIVPDIDKNLFLDYALIRGKSIINEMADILEENITFQTDVKSLVERFQIKFKKYYDFLEQLPHVVILNDKILLTHSGLIDTNNIPVYSDELIKIDRYYTKKTYNDKLVIVGHYPTINYGSNYASCDPIIDLDKNIISIDGGHNVVDYGQLNILLINNIVDMKISFETIDNFQDVLIKEDFNGNEDNSFNLAFGKYKVNILETYDDFYNVFVEEVNKEMLILKKNVITNDFTYIIEGSNLVHSVKKGEKVKLIEKFSKYSYIKKNGNIGLIPTKLID